MAKRLGGYKQLEKQISQRPSSIPTNENKQALTSPRQSTNRAMLPQIHSVLDRLRGNGSDGRVGQILGLKTGSRTLAT